VILIKIAAIYNIIFGIFHLYFWKLLNWKEQLKRVSSNNKAVVQTLNICLTFIFFLNAYIFFFYTDEIQTTEIGRILLIGIGLF